MQEVTKTFCYQYISLKGTERMQSFIKWRLCSCKCFQAHGADDIGGFEAIMQSLNGVNGKAQYELSSVDQRQSFFWSQLNGRNIFLFQDRSSFRPHSFIIALTQSYQRQK